MPRASGTALGKVRPGLSARKKVQLALYGDQEANPYWSLANLIRAFVDENVISDSGLVNTGSDAVLMGSTDSAAGLKQEVFNHVVGAIAAKDDRFFLRMAEAVAAGKRIWKGDRWEVTDPVLFAIIEARNQLVNRGVCRVRPKDIADALHGEYDPKTIRDRIKRYGIPGFDTRPGRPKSAPKKPRHKEPDLATTKRMVKAAVTKRKLPNKF